MLGGQNYFSYVYQKGDASDAASLTVRLDDRIHSKIKIRREYQGYESKPFKTTFGGLYYEYTYVEMKHETLFTPSNFF